MSRIIVRSETFQTTLVALLWTPILLALTTVLRTSWLAWRRMRSERSQLISGHEP